MEPPTTKRLKLTQKTKVLDTRVSNGTNNVLSVFFFTFSVIHKLFGVLEKHGSLGVTLLSIQGAAINSNFGLGHAGDGAFSLTADDHTLQDVRFVQVGAHDLADTNVFRVEEFGVLGQGLDAELGNLFGEIGGIAH